MKVVRDLMRWKTADGGRIVYRRDRSLYARGPEIGAKYRRILGGLSAERACAWVQTLAPGAQLICRSKNTPTKRRLWIPAEAPRGRRWAENWPRLLPADMLADRERRIAAHEQRVAAELEARKLIAPAKKSA